MSAALLLIAMIAAVSYANRQRGPRDPYAHLGPLPPTWRPVPRTIVRTNHLIQ